MQAMYPFERFGEDAKRSLTLAQEEAVRSHHSYIGTEHLLLGLMREGRGTASRVLTKLGIEVGIVRSTIEAVLGRNERILIHQIVPTSRVKKVIELAFEEARRMKMEQVDTGHLLLGLVLEGEGIAAHVLKDLGATQGRVVDAVEAEYGPEPQARRSRRTNIARPSFRGTPGLMRRLWSFAPGVAPVDEIEDFVRLLGNASIAKLLAARGVDVAELKRLLADEPQEVRELRGRLASLRAALESRVQSGDFESAAKTRDEQKETAEQLEQAQKEWLDSL